MLPTPDPTAHAHHLRVVADLHARIASAGGWLPFSAYMDAVLYAPGLGYYTAGATKLGAAGDFVTAPEMTPFFGRTLARAIAPALRETSGAVLEIGAGSGRLAVDILGALETLDTLPERYCILDVSADLRLRQQATLAEALPHLVGRVEWLDALPQDFVGVVLGNEVLDALPVDRIHWTLDGPMSQGVAVVDGEFVWQDRAIDDPTLRRRADALGLPAGYVSEINLAAEALVASIGRALTRGLVLMIDYGFGAREYYHPQRVAGTLRVHYRHHALDDPFYLPGLCDLTAHVDFSAMHRAAESAGLSLAGYASQAGFLLDAGLTDLMQTLSPHDAASYLPQANAVQRLVSPAEMGELFKAIAWTRGEQIPVVGFGRSGDRRHTL